MYRHPLNWLARLGRPRYEADALLGDLQQQRAALIAAGHSGPRAARWHAGQLLAAGVHGSGLILRSLLRPRLVADTRYAFRRWRRRPGFAVAAIATLALGIGSATAVFSVVDHVLLKPLPWQSPDTLVQVHGVYPERRNSLATAPTWDRWYVSYPGWDALRESPAFSDVAAWRGLIGLHYTLGDDGTELIRTMEVSSSFLPMLGVKLAYGRYFTTEEDDRSTESIILSHETWVRHFGARPDVIGERVNTPDASSGGGYPRTIVGVLEPGFSFGSERPDILLPVGIPAQVSRRYPSPHLRILARLAPGVTPEMADAAARPLVEGAPNQQRGSARVVALEDELLGAARRPLWLIFGGAGLLLLIACANVAGLLIAEARTRRHEIAVRMALGGSRLRVVRQLLIEHAWLAVFGTTLGIVAAYWLAGTLVAIAPEALPRIDGVVLDLRAAAFAGVVGLATLLFFGVIPAFSLARTPVSDVLAEGSRDGAVNRALGARAIVAGQLALALVLLIGASLFAETMLRLRAGPLGFESRNVAVIATTFTGARYGDGSALRQARNSGVPFNMGELMTRQATIVNNDLTDRVVPRLRTLPGVVAVGGASIVPFVTSPGRYDVVIGEDGPENRQDAWRQTVNDSYFSTLGINAIEGRTFTTADAGGERVVVVSREFQRQFYPQGAVGQVFRQVYGGNYELEVPYRIIGVVGDVKRQEYTDDLRPLVYEFDRHYGGITHFIMRTSGDPGSILPAARAAIADVSRQLVISDVAILDERVARSIAEERFRATLSMVFGAIALVLAAVGLYGLAARRATERRREFGVRVALGARPADVRRLVFRDAGTLIGLGLLIGLPAAWWAAQIAQSMLYGVQATSLRVYATTAVVLAIVALLATALPARRASTADPIEVIRN
jgi:putative ABC transport system permease protein